MGSSTYGIVPTIIKSFRANYPDVALSLIPMNNAGLHRALIRREIDVAIARPGLADAEFVTRKLIDEALVLAAPDRLGRRAAVDLRDLEDMVLIFYPEFPRPSFADFVLDQCRAQGVEVANRVFTQDLQTALALVAIGEGACIVPEPVGHAARNGVQFLRIVPPLATTALSISHRLDERSVHVQNFARIAQAVARRTL